MRPSDAPPDVGPLPDPPRLHAWPVAVRQAELRDGSLVRCGPGLRPVGWPETPRVRAAALSEWLSGGRIATHLTAAWVWGCARSGDRPITLSEPRGRRVETVGCPGTLVRELSLRPNEIVSFGGCAVTSPERTLLDLLRDERFAQRETVACRLLWQTLSAHDRRRLLTRPLPRRPFNGRAARRIAKVWGSRPQ